MEVISKFKPEASDSTIKTYASQLHILQKRFNSNNFDFLNDFDKVLAILGDLSDSTRKNYINSVIVYLQAIDGDVSLISKYQKVRDELSKKYVDAQESGVISDKQKNNFATTEDITSMIKRMKNDLSKSADLELYQAYMLFNIYLKLPLRNDVAGMISMKESDFKKLKDNTKVNYIVVGKSKIDLILNNYKTKKTYGQKIIEVEDQQLKKLLRQFIKRVGFGIMFTQKNGEPMSRNRITQILIKYSEKYMNKRVSSTLLAKAYLSGKYSGVPKEIHKEMVKDANVRGHSVGVQQMIYNKSS